jgi:hypothetical protein
MFSRPHKILVKTIGYSRANYPVDDLAWIQLQIVFK